VPVADLKNSVHLRKISTILLWIFYLQTLSETRSAQTVGKVPVLILQRIVRFFTNALKCFVKSATGTAFSKKSEAIQPSGRRGFKIYIGIRVMPGFSQHLNNFLHNFAEQVFKTVLLHWMTV